MIQVEFSETGPVVDVNLIANGFGFGPAQN